MQSNTVGISRIDFKCSAIVVVLLLDYHELSKSRCITNALSLFGVHSEVSDGIRNVMPLGLHLESDQNVSNAVRILLEYSDCRWNTYRKIFGLQIVHTSNVILSVHQLECSRTVLSMCKTFGTACSIDTKTVIMWSEVLEFNLEFKGIY